MKLPKSFECFARKIKVESVPGYKENGEYFPNDDLIRLDSSLDKDKIEDNFFHELAHVFMDVMGKNELYEDEVFCEVLGNLICQFLRTKK